MRRHPQQRADGDDPGPADAGHEDAVGFIESGEGGLGQRRQLLLAEMRALPLLELAAIHGDKARAETLDAGIVLVAARLIDSPLAPELGFDRNDREAVRGFRAIAATLAHQIVDEHPFGRVREAAAFAAPTLLSRTSLVVNDHGDTRDLVQFSLDGIEIVTVA